MIDIVFSDSACGSLKLAQHYGSGSYCGGVGVVVIHTDGSKATEKEIEAAQREAEEKNRLRWERSVPMGGNPADVFGFNLALSVGDISENEPGTLRRQELEHLYSIHPSDVGLEAAQILLQSAQDNLKTVCNRAVMGEDIRIWYSNQPDELCGLNWFMAQLNQWGGPFGQVYLVKLPEWEANEEGNIIQTNSWGELDPGEWHRYLTLQRLAPPVFCQSCAAHWRVLQTENALLRAMLNGQLVSAPETLYDDFILREIAAADDTFQEAMVIGRALTKYRLGIGDAWVALRIEEMLRTGKLEAVTEAADDMPIYHRLLKKTSNVSFSLCL